MMLSFLLFISGIAMIVLGSSWIVENGTMLARRLGMNDLLMLIVAGVLLQMFVTTGRKFVRLEALVMIAISALFLAAQFRGFSISLS